MKISALLKKHASAFALLLALLLLITTATGCFNRADPIEELLPAIKEAHLKPYGEDAPHNGVSAVVYYGRYNGVDVVMVLVDWDVRFPATHECMIEGFAFELSYGTYIQAWKDGKLIDLQAAYDQGLLTRVQIAEIAEIHKNKSYTVFQ